MLACEYNAGRAWRDKMDGVRTIECLRGRLQAERTATKLARHEAQLMETKLIELENQLNEETMFKDKAEKKLKSLLNKLNSLNINYVSEEDLENYGSRVSITAKYAEVYKLKELNPEGCISESSVAKAITGSKTTSNCSEDASSTVTTKSELNAQIVSVEKFLDLKSNTVNQGTNKLKSPNEEQNAGNSLTLSSQKIADLKLSDYSETVDQALNALTHARKEIERSMERKRMVNAKWVQLMLS